MQLRTHETLKPSRHNGALAFSPIGEKFGYQTPLIVSGILSALLALALGLAGSFGFSRWSRRLFSGYHRELQAAQEKLRIAAIAFESQEGIFVTDTRGKILNVNRSFTARPSKPTAVPDAVRRNSGSRVRLPMMFTLFKLICVSFR